MAADRRSITTRGLATRAGLIRCPVPDLILIPTGAFPAEQLPRAARSSQKVTDEKNDTISRHQGTGVKADRASMQKSTTWRTEVHHLHVGLP